MWSLPEVETIIADIMNQTTAQTTPADLQRLSPEDAERLIESHKTSADSSWATDPHVSLRHADQIVLIGQHRCDPQAIALGLMSRGDALKFLGQIHQAWDMLTLAGRLYASVGDEVGWARTCIGKLYIAPDTNQTQAALEDARAAAEILRRRDEKERLLRLNLNTGYVHDRMGAWDLALAIYSEAITVAESMGEAGQQYLGILHTNIGVVYMELGSLNQAISCLERAYDIFRARRDTAYTIYVNTNIANAAMMQGRYRYALNLLHRIEDLTADKLPLDYLIAQRIRVECYVRLNRHQEAIDLARIVALTFRELGTNQDLGYLLRHLAVAYAEIGEFDAASEALDEAKAIFTFNEALAWSADVTLKKAQVALKQGDLTTAAREVEAVRPYFEQQSNQLNSAQTSLLLGQIAYARQRWESAAAEAHQALHIARLRELPDMDYSSHLLLGKIAEAQSNDRLAINHYTAAVTTIEQLQRELTISLRPAFLENREEALHRLLALQLHRGYGHEAFETLERAKSVNILNHLTNPENLRWTSTNPDTARLVDELAQLRLEHHHTYQQAVEGKPQARQRLQSCEERIRSLTQRLYLMQDHHFSHLQQPITTAAIQAAVPPGTALLEYYDDGSRLWAFVLDQHTLTVRPLDVTSREIEDERAQLQFDIECALALSSARGPLAPEVAQLTPILHERLAWFYDRLLQPLGESIHGRERLLIVPYGALHYLPFNLLRHDDHYLIEHQEVVLLPTSALLTVPAPSPAPGFRVLANSWGSRLVATLQEARLIHEQTAAELILEDAANRAALAVPPCQVLHIAAHAQHRVDHPELSFIELADGQLYADDLFQHDLSYELVVLSGCETGRAKAVRGDELIGLGRGFLYSGAGAILASLWQIPDDMTVHYMQHFYSALQQGASKSAAQRQAQCALLQMVPGLNPSLWGAFQLMGSAAPLSLK